MTPTTPILGPAPAGPASVAVPKAAGSADAGEVFQALVQGLLDGPAGQPPPGAPGDRTDDIEDIGDPTDLPPDVSVDLPPGVPVDLGPSTLPSPFAPVPVVSRDAAAPTAPVLSAPVPRPVTTVAATSDGPTASTTSATTPAIPAAISPAISPAVSPANPGRPTAERSTPEDPIAAPIPSVGAPPPVAAARPADVLLTTAPIDTHRVTQQVFPEVVRVTSSAEGPRRVTVKLNPESLGEVRVVLTSRRGGLDVSLAAGSEARRALVEGAPELQRLLESVGRGDSRITVRDLAGTPVTAAVQLPTSQPTTQPTNPTTTQPAGTGLSADLQGDGRPDARQHPRGGSTAMDGTPGATTPSRRTQPVTRARPGLDVTM